MPKWFVIGCGVVLLNVGLVLVSVVFRHANADDVVAATAVPTEASDNRATDEGSSTDTLPPSEVDASGTTVAPANASSTIPPNNNAPGITSAEITAADVGTVPSLGRTGLEDSGSPVSSGNQAGQLALPKVPSIETVPSSVMGNPTEAELATGNPVGQPSLLTLEDFKRVFAQDRDLGELPPAVITAPQLSQGFFDALELRLDAVSSLNNAAKNLIQEASILYQRGEVNESRHLLGKATQLRELAAQLLVTRQ